MPTDEQHAIETPGGNKLWCTGGILHYLVSAPVDGNEATLLSGKGIELLNAENASSVLIDLKQSTQFSSDARKIWVRFLQDPKIKKTALFGGNVFVRTLASFVIAASNKQNIKFFTAEDEAIEWLKS